MEITLKTTNQNKLQCCNVAMLQSDFKLNGELDEEDQLVE
jgi:hypothetical protein